MPEYKGCPLLVQSDTYPSLTMRGESHTRTYMLECLGERCTAFCAQDAFCNKFMGCVSLSKSAQKEEQ